MNVDAIIRTVKESVEGKQSVNRGREYISWLDTKPKFFLTFREWMLSYHEGEEY